MKREEVNEFLLKIKNKNLLLELPTSFGKTKIALDILNNKVSLDAIKKSKAINYGKDYRKKTDEMNKKLF